MDEMRHCQWHAVIRIFEILQFSLLFLIIIINNQNCDSPECLSSIQMISSSERTILIADERTTLILHRIQFISVL
jgi:hypothetical protein